MPYVYEDRVRGSSAYLERVQTPLSMVLEEQFAIAMEESPILASIRWGQLQRAKGEGSKISQADAWKQIDDAGLRGTLEINRAGITQAALDTLMFRKQRELRRQEIFSRSRGGFIQGVARLGVALPTMVIDPVNVAMAFVPVIGQARYLQMLARARGSFGRLGVRAGVGAVEGAAGATIIEPLIAASRSAEQADYDSIDSLLNVAFGGIFGSTLHGTVGGLKDAIEFGARRYRARRDRNRPPTSPPPPLTPPLTDRPLSVSRREFIQVATAVAVVGGGQLDTLVGRMLGAPIEDPTRTLAILGRAYYKVIQAIADITEGRYDDPTLTGRVESRTVFKELKRIFEEVGKELPAELDTANVADEVGEALSGVLDRVSDDDIANAMRKQFNPAGDRSDEQLIDAFLEDLQEDFWRYDHSLDYTDEGVWAVEELEELLDIDRGLLPPEAIDEYINTGKMVAEEVWKRSNPDLVERTREAVGEAVEDEPIQIEHQPDEPWVEGTRGEDPEVREAIEQAEQTLKEEPELPEEAIDETVAEAEAELRETERRLELERIEREEPEILPRGLDDDFERVNQDADKGERWGKAAEIVESCLLRGES